MTELRTAASLALPWIAGALACRALLPGRARLEHAAAGWFVGQFVAVFSLLLMLLAGATVGARDAILPVLALGAAGLVASRRRSPRVQVAAKPAESGLSTAWRVIVALAATLLAVKIALVCVSWSYAPIRHDDAITIWLLRAKVIAGLGRLPLDPSGPLYLGGTHADYPLPASLVAAWVAIVRGAWSETTVTLPWSLAWLNLLLLVFARFRDRCGRDIGLLAAWAVSSMPLLLVHAIRPGYADLPLAAFLAAAALYLLDWRDDGSPAALGPGLLFLIAAAAMKREGVIPAGCVLASLVAGPLVRARMARVDRWVLAGGAVVAAIMLMVAIPRAAFVDPLSAFEWNPDALGVLIRHAFAWASFGPFWIVALVAAMLASRRKVARPAALLTLLLIAYAAGVFILTKNARFAFNDQTPSRVLLQIAPAIAVALVWSLTPRGDAATAALRGRTL